MAVFFVIQSFGVEESMGGGLGTLVIVISNPMEVKVELGCSDMLGVNAISMGLASTSAFSIQVKFGFDLHR